MVEKVKGKGGRRMRGQESKKAKGSEATKTSSVEDRAVETLAAFLGLVHAVLGCI